jgi:FMN phosphatase YigB (HAD superfamily)
MLTPDPVVFLLDVDNTLLDNDRFKTELSAWLEHGFGAIERQRYWKIYDALREQLGYADYLGALQEFRGASAAQAELQLTSDFLLEYPFAKLLYPDTLQAIAHLAAFGRVVIVSDGDMVFQPRKIRLSGLAAAVNHHVLIYVHKQRSLADLELRFPAARYVMVDDKPLLLAAMKQILGAQLSTVFVRQGHYAAESAGKIIEPPPDRTIERIGDLLAFALNDFFPAAASAPPAPAKELP